MKIFIKRLTAIMLGLSLVIGTVYVPEAAAKTKGALEDEPALSAKQAENDNPITNETDEPQTYESDAYDSTAVDESILFSHTDSSSQLIESDDTYNKKTEDDTTTFTSDESAYRTLGFETSEMTKNLDEVKNDESYRDPLAGYTFVDPNELMVLKTKDYTTTINTISDNTFIKSSAMQWKKAVDDIEFAKDTSIQGEAVQMLDMDGDGIDELVKYRIYVQDDKTYGKLLSYKKYSDDNWVTYKTIATDIKISEKTRLKDNFHVDEKAGYMSMAAGDFDGDGKGEELAVYIPGDNGDSKTSGPGPRILIYKELNKIGQIYLQDIRADYGKLNDSYHVPSVSLQATNTRLGDKIDRESKSYTKYKTHTDLVVNVTVPKNYNGNKDISSLNATTTIFSYDASKKGFVKQMNTVEWKPFSDNGNYRMNCVNTCDADLNGDGFDEIVVAGYRQQVSSLSDTAYGDFKADVNYVNIISCDNDKYSVLWKKPKAVTCDKNPKNYFNINNKSMGQPSPIALCAGHYDGTTGETFDQIYIFGAVIGASGTKISGTPTRLEKTTDSSGKDVVTYCAIPDPIPNRNSVNFPEDTVKLNTLFAPYSDTDYSVMMINQAVSGKFNTGLGTDTIVTVFSRRWGGFDNLGFCVDVIGYYPDDGGWQINNDDYIRGMKDADEDDDGTSISLCFGNIEEDSFYYKYTGTYSVYSKPELYALVQAPPYYEEANAATTKLILTTAVAQNDSCSAGLNFGYSHIFGNPNVFSVTPTVNTNVTYGHNTNKSKTITKTLFLKADKDYCVTYAVPVVTNVYDIIEQETGAHSSYETYESMTPEFAACSIADYNAAVPDDEKINPASLPASAAGDPTLYDSTVPQIDSSNKTSGQGISTTVNDTISKFDDTVSFSEAVGDSVTANGSVNVAVKLGKNTISGGLSGGGGSAWTNTKGMGFDVTYDGLPTSLKDGAVFAENQYESDYGTSKTITHAAMLDYKYTSSIVARPIKNVISGFKNPSAYLVSFYTANYNILPEQPKGFTSQNVEQTTDANGKKLLKVKLMWESAVKNPVRNKTGAQGMGYNIYETDKNNPSLLHLVNTELITKASNSNYTEYEITYREGQWNNKPKYYVVPAWKDESGNVREGTLESSCVIDVAGETDGDVIVTKNPASYPMKSDSSDEKATFSISLRKKEGLSAYQLADGSYKPINLSWQVKKYGGSWETVKTDSLKVEGDDDNAEKSAEFEFDLTGAEKSSYDDATVRCVVSYGTYTKNSKTVFIEWASKTMVSGGLKYKKTGSGTVQVVGLDTGELTKSAKKKITEKIVIPASIKNNGRTYKVTSIKAGAFNKCTGLKSLTVGKNVVEIGKGAFAHSKKLKKITIKSTVLKKKLIKYFLLKSYVKELKVPKSVLKKYKKLLTKKHTGARYKIKVSK